MNFRKTLKKSIFALFILLLLTILYTLLLYLKILKTDNISFKIITFTIAFSSFFIMSYLLTCNTTKRGWLKGMIIGLGLLTVPIILNITNKSSLNLNIFLKFISLLTSSIFAGIINVNKNKEK